MRAAIRKLIILLLLGAGAAHSAEWKIDPTLGLSAGYNDNIRMDPSNKVSSAEATFSPRTTFSVATPTSGASGNVRFDFRRYEDDSNLDDNNSRFEVNSFHNLERSRLGLDFGFIKDTTLDSQLEATGLAIFDRVRRETINVSPNWTWSFSPRTRLSANYGYSDVAYKNAGGSGFVDFTLNSAETSLIHVLNERATTSITLSRTKSDNDNDVESTNTNLQAGTSYQFSETLSGTLFAGVRRTEVEFSRTSLIPIRSGGVIIGFVPLNSNESNSDWGSTFSASLTKTFLRGEIGLSASRNISNDINGRPIEVTRLRTTSLYRFSEIFSASLNLEFYNSKTNNDVANNLNADYYQIGPTFNWAFEKFWSLSGNYRYRKQTFDDSSDAATQNAAYLTLTYRWPRIAVSR